LLSLLQMFLIFILVSVFIIKNNFPENKKTMGIEIIFTGIYEKCNKHSRKKCVVYFPTGHRVKTDCTEFSSTSCLPCSDGTHLDQSNGLKSCTRCSICHSAGLKVKQQCLRSADTVCEPMEGFYCTDSTSGGCAAAQKHRSCEPGQYISRMGTASTDTECSECSSGTFSNGTMLSCQLHTQCEKENLQLIKAGTTTTDAECGEKNDSITGVGIIVLVVSLVIVYLVYEIIYFILYIKGPSRRSRTGIDQGSPTPVLKGYHPATLNSPLLQNV
uniref:Tumor necrosis factor receptor superfamily member 5-like n=1 Tax=Poecilia reticulata TaxID=8081 RepID=A0A3P9NFG9_POERE